MKTVEAPKKQRKPSEPKPLVKGILCSICGEDLSGKLPGEYEYVKTGRSRRPDLYFCEGMKCRTGNTLVVG